MLHVLTTFTYTSHLKKSSKYLIFTIHISTGNDATVLKLAKKAHQFVKERDGALLTAFETNDLDYVNFRIFFKTIAAARVHGRRVHESVLFLRS